MFLGGVCRVVIFHCFLRSGRIPGQLAHRYNGTDILALLKRNLSVIWGGNSARPLEAHAKNLFALLAEGP